jgi:hypothetical protein
MKRTPDNRSAMQRSTIFGVFIGSIDRSVTAQIATGRQIFENRKWSTGKIATAQIRLDVINRF